MRKKILRALKKFLKACFKNYSKNPSGQPAIYPVNTYLDVLVTKACIRNEYILF